MDNVDVFVSEKILFTTMLASDMRTLNWKIENVKQFLEWYLDPIT